jgi:hypothetical protein
MRWRQMVAGKCWREKGTRIKCDQPDESSSASLTRPCRAGQARLDPFRVVQHDLFSCRGARGIYADWVCPTQKVTEGDMPKRQ